MKRRQMGLQGVALWTVRSTSWNMKLDLQVQRGKGNGKNASRAIEWLKEDVHIYSLLRRSEKTR